MVVVVVRRDRRGEGADEREIPAGADASPEEEEEWSQFNSESG